MTGSSYPLISLRNLTEVVVTRRMDAGQAKIRGVMGRALSIRQVDAGSCNGCELEISALHNPYYNLEGLGIRFVASPRHADLLMVTGPVTQAMRTPLLRTYAAMAHPRWVIAVGNCPQDGGVFRNSYATTNGIGELLPVDAYVPGCPPSPLAILDGILQLLGLQRQASG